MKSLSFLLVCLLLLPSAAHGKALRRMGATELLEVLENHDRAEKRIEAIELFVSRGEESVIPQLGARCGVDPAWTVCDAALKALRSFGTEEARGEIQGVLLADEPLPAQRKLALSFLLEDEEQLAIEAVHDLIPRYASQDAQLMGDVIVASQTLALSSLADFLLFLSLDGEADRSMRLAALDAVEDFGHPRLHETHMALLFDTDPKIRIRCATQLGAEGLPGSQVVPLLRQLLSSDPEGYVREAATKTLAQWAHPEILPLLHERVLQDRHPVAWEASFHLLIALGDESSVETLTTLILTNRRLRPSQGDAAVRLLTHLNAMSAISAIYDLEQRHQGTPLAQACVRAVEILELEGYEQQQALLRFPRGELLPTRAWSTETPDPEFPPLGVQLDTSSGLLVRIATAAPEDPGTEE